MSRQDSSTKISTDTRGEREDSEQENGSLARGEKVGTMRSCRSLPSTPGESFPSVHYECYESGKWDRIPEIFAVSVPMALPVTEEIPDSSHFQGPRQSATHLLIFR